MHIWSFDAAVIARYIQDKISPQAAEEYRRAVFANQSPIASKEDLTAFTQKYFQSHGRVMPMIIDPNGLFAAEVRADYTLGERVGLTQTPTIFIVTQKGFVQVTDVGQLYAMLDTAIAENPRPQSRCCEAEDYGTQIIAARINQKRPGHELGPFLREHQQRETTSSQSPSTETTSHPHSPAPTASETHPRYAHPSGCSAAESAVRSK